MPLTTSLFPSCSLSSCSLSVALLSRQLLRRPIDSSEAPHLHHHHASVVTGSLRCLKALVFGFLTCFACLLAVVSCFFVFFRCGVVEVPGSVLSVRHLHHGALVAVVQKVAAFQSSGGRERERESGYDAWVS